MSLGHKGLKKNRIYGADEADEKPNYLEKNKF